MECVQIANCQNDFREDVNLISQRMIELTDFYCFLLTQDEWENDIIINRKHDYDRGIWDKVIYCDSNNFYDKIGIGIWEFERNFVSFKYIDVLENNGFLIIRVDGRTREFVLSV